MQRDFKGVWIPKEIWLDEEISWMEKLFLTEIDSLVKNGECFATNEYFAKFFKLSKDRASRIINTLAKKKYIEIKLVYKEGTKQIQKRTITTAGHKLKLVEQMLGKPIGEFVDTPIGENNDTPIGESNDTPIGENADTPIGENNEDNNTLINNTLINNTNIKDNSMLSSSSSKKESKKTTNNPLFEEFWKLYPKKINKKKASVSFETALKNNEFDTIMSGLKRYIAKLEKEETASKYILLATTFLNNDRFLDEFEEKSFAKNKKRVNDPDDYGPEFFDNLEKQKQQSQSDAEAEFLGF